KKEKSLNVLARKCKGFTVYFTDELIKPGEKFHLFVNNVPWKDLVDPETTPEYPVIRHGTDPLLRDNLRRMRKRRAKVEGWTPDLRFAVEQALERRDRGLVLAAKRSYDLTNRKKAFESARKRFEMVGVERGTRVKEAYEGWRAKG
ncbi:MAG: hypothetical protein ACYSUN_14435, partial [Planctomycetota bacterium]